MNVNNIFSKSKCFVSTITLVALLTACSPTNNSAQQAQERMNLTLSSWVGRNVAEFAIQYGRPTDFVKISNNVAVFRWTTYSQTAGAVVPIGGIMAVVPSRSLACNVRLTAASKVGSNELRVWTIQRYQFDGYC